MNLKITRALLNEYRDMRKKRTIPILELELEEMKQGDNGLGNSTVFDYRTGQARPQSGGGTVDRINRGWTDQVRL